VSTSPVVLFVDDEPRVVEGLRRMLRSKARDWTLLTATSGAEALQILREREVDAVVSDMRMPGMNGAELLAAVQRERPATARIILSGQSDRAAVLDAVGPAQQFLAKPCDADIVLAAVRRAVGVRRMLAGGKLLEIIGGTASLPKPPQVYQELVEALAAPGADLSRVARILDAHMATRVEVLRLVNSAFFGLPRQIDSVDAAVGLLGVDNLQAVVLATSLFRQGDRLPAELDPERLEELAVRRGAVARRLTALEGLQRPEADAVLLAALLHDVGLLVLASALPQAYTGLGAGYGELEPAARSAAEREAFGCTVPEAGASLLALWGFPDLVVQALATQPVAPDDAEAPANEHIVAAADRYSRGLPIRGTGPYLDEARATRWDAAAREALAGEPTEPPAP
jgi:HD-like signal output (HDOD) protein